MREIVIGFGRGLEADRIATYLLFAEVWGWTPREVDEMDCDTVMKMRQVAIELLREKEMMMKKRKGQEWIWHG